MEAVAAFRDRCNSGLTVEPAPVAVGGSTALPMSSFPDLVRLVLSLSGSVDQRGAVLGSLLSAAAVTGAGGVPAPTTTVTSAAPVACWSTVPAPGGSTPAGAVSVTASPRRCERAQETSCPEKRHRQLSGRERSRSGGKSGGGRSPSPARSTRSPSVSASSSSESLDSEVRVSAMSPPPSKRPGAGGGRSGSDKLSIWPCPLPSAWSFGSGLGYAGCAARGPISLGAARSLSACSFGCGGRGSR